MAIGTRDNDNFCDHILDTRGMLESAIDWIKKNLNPDDVFGEKELSTWAEENGYTKEDN